jgi:predicted phage terminase large subunit-like protein
VEELKNDLRLVLGEFGVDSQLQQRPTPIGGGMFKPEFLIKVHVWPPVNELQKIVRYWDKAATAGGGAYTAGALMALHTTTQRTIILDVVRGQWGTDERESMIRDTAYQDMRRLGIAGRPERLVVKVEQEPGSGGKDSALFTCTKTLAGLNAHRVPKTSDKISEWNPFSAQVNLGAVEIFVGPWNEALESEMRGAPFGKFKDQLDACSGGFKHIWIGSRAGILG